MDIVCSTKIQPTFTSKNLFTREIDTIARRVHLEYPTLSNTALKRFSVKDKTKQNQQFLTFISAYINKLRNYYTNSNSKIERIIKIIKGVEKTKIANCNEQAILTAIALKLNGYKNIQLYSIHAYNKDTGIIKNMDHLVVGINIKKPKDYIEKLPSEPISIEHLISPNNQSIIVDNWAGITEDANSYLTKCKGEINLNKKLSGKEKIMLFPYDDLNISDYQLDVLHQYFHKLNFKQTPTKKVKTIPFNFKFENIEIQEIDILKQSKGLSPRIKLISAIPSEEKENIIRKNLNKISKFVQKIAVM